MRLRARAAALPIAMLLASCGSGSSYPPELTATAPPAGVPRKAAGLLPPELGAVDGPSGTSNARDGRYDAVGYASWYGEEIAGGATASGAPFDPAAITAAHRTLALGSYAEVTALDTGRTILVLVNDRGPGRTDREIDLSRGAAQLLGVSGKPVSPVRVRSIVPAPADIQALRQGQPASARLDAPPALLTALRRTLPTPGGKAKVSPTAPRRTEPPLALDLPTPPASRSGAFVVQVATFSNEARAEALAKRLKGRVVANGDLWRVRLGPFADRASANRARDAAAAQGYGDAQIQTND